MVGSNVKFENDGNKVEGVITDICNHQDGTVEYEVLTNDKIHYLTDDSFQITKKASQGNKDNITMGDKAIVNQMSKNLNYIQNSQLKSELNQILNRYS